MRAVHQAAEQLQSLAACASLVEGELGVAALDDALVSLLDVLRQHDVPILAHGLQPHTQVEIAGAGMCRCLQDMKGWCEGSAQAQRERHQQTTLLRMHTAAGHA